MKNVQAVLFGKVQGVGLRNFAWKLAMEYDVKGRIENLPDGTVQLNVQCADPEKLDEFLEEIKKGNGKLSINTMQIYPQSSEEIYTDFTIVRE